MANQQILQNLDDDFAQKCRTALEKSWGIEIPKPKQKQKPIALRMNSKESSNYNW